MTLYNDFPTDVHRRVAGNLAEPRSLSAIVRELDADPFCPLGLGDENLIAQVLSELETLGDVVNLGLLVESDELASASRRNERAITLHPDKEALLLERATAQPQRYLQGGDKWLLAVQGLDKLTGPAPPEQIPQPVPEAVAEPAELGRLRGFLRRMR